MPHGRNTGSFSVHRDLEHHRRIIDWQFFTQVSVSQTDDVKAVTATSSAPVQSIVGLIVFSRIWPSRGDGCMTPAQRAFRLASDPVDCRRVCGADFGIGLASHFQHGGSLDILFTRATLLIVIPTLLVLFVSPLLVLWC